MRSHSLQKIPDTFSSELSYLNLQHCPNLQVAPRFLQELKCALSALQELPESVQRLWNMQRVKLPCHISKSGVFGSVDATCWYVKLGDCENGAGCFHAKDSLPCLVLGPNRLFPLSGAGVYAWQRQS